MVIYYATVFDSKNIHPWSGLGYYIGQMLERQGHNLVYLNDLALPNPLLLKLKKYLLRKMLDQSYSPNFENRIAEVYARQISKKVPKGSLLLSPNTILLSKLDKSYKTVLYTDSTFNQLLDFYPSFTNIPKNIILQAQRIEQAALNRTDLLIYSSQWAVNSAVNDYKIAREKTAVVPFGPNIDFSIAASVIPQIIKGRMESKVIHLLLIAVAWHRKGGSYAVEVLQHLLSKGFKAKLHITGIRTLPPGIENNNIVHHGFVSKSTTSGQEYLTALFKESHFLLLPSRADCTPVAVSEANSFALPCLISNVGGNADVVENGVNGMVFDFTKGPKECADYIIHMHINPEQYKNLTTSSYRKFTEELNWETSGKKMTELLNKLANVSSDSVDQTAFKRA